MYKWSHTATPRYPFMTCTWKTLPLFRALTELALNTGMFIDATVDLMTRVALNKCS
jgi:hypothetical protein